MRAAALHAAVTGRLVQQDLADDSVESRTRYPEGSAVSVGAAPFALPAGWHWAPGHAVASFIDPQPSHRTPPAAKNGVPYIGYSDITRDATINFAEARRVSPTVLQEQALRYTLKAGDFAFGKIGTVGQPFLLPEPFDYTLSANLILVQPDTEVVVPAYLAAFFRSPFAITELLSQAHDTTYAAFGIKKARNFPIPLPPLTEQRRIVAQLQLFDSAASILTGAIGQLSLKVASLRSASLTAAFSGKLVPQDPTDEPASILVERVAAEQATSNGHNPARTSKSRMKVDA
jgi:type I restriction enzyme S subunit